MSYESSLREQVREIRRAARSPEALRQRAIDSDLESVVAERAAAIRLRAPLSHIQRLDKQISLLWEEKLS